MLYHERKGSGRALNETRATMDDKHLKVDGRYKGFEAGSGGGQRQVMEWRHAWRKGQETGFEKSRNGYKKNRDGQTRQENLGRRVRRQWGSRSLEEGAPSKGRPGRR